LVGAELHESGRRGVTERHERKGVKVRGAAVDLGELKLWH
jgi:hypothetical protein